MFINFSIKGFFRYIFLKIQGKEVIRTGTCHQCGKCCTNFNLKSKGSWIYTKAQFDDLINESPEYSRLKVIGQDNRGLLQFSCKLLQEDGKCGDYKNRLPICKDYPNVSRYYSGNYLPERCGFNLEAVVPFEKILNKKIKQQHKIICTAMYAS